MYERNQYYDTPLCKHTVKPLRSASTTSLVPNRNRTVRYGRRLLDTSEKALWNTMPEELRNAVMQCCSF